MLALAWWGITSSIRGLTARIGWLSRIDSNEPIHVSGFAELVELADAINRHMGRFQSVPDESPEVRRTPQGRPNPDKTSKPLVVVSEDDVSNLSHELKNPLTNISVCAEMLVDEDVQGPQTRQELCLIVQEQVQRLTRMIDDVLDSSLLDAGMAKESRRQLDLVEVCQEVVNAMAPQARDKQIHLEHQSAGVPLTAWADKDMLYQAIMNLASNALKYSIAGQRVTIRSFVSQNGQVAVEVKDQGVGIPKEAMPRIFDKYYRVQEHSHMARGTGLGLNLVRQIVEGIHHGHITVQSELGSGSVFTINLPVRSGVSARDGRARTLKR